VRPVHNTTRGFCEPCGLRRCSYRTPVYWSIIEVVVIAALLILLAFVSTYGAAPAPRGGLGSGSIATICPAWPCVLEGVTLHQETAPAPSCARIRERRFFGDLGVDSTMAEALRQLARVARLAGADTVHLSDRHLRLFRNGRVRASVAAGTAYRCTSTEGR
jgi:hypothetical protein